MTLLQDNIGASTSDDPDAILQRQLSRLGIYERWPDDPGPSLEMAPFDIARGEAMLLKNVHVTFKRRSVDGNFIFEPDSGAAEILRSGARLEAEFMAGLVDRIDRRGRTDRDAFRKQVEEADVRFVQENATNNFLETARTKKAYVEAYTSAKATLGKLPLSGPRTKGGRADPHDPPRNLAEVIANKALELGDDSPPSWKTLLPYLHRTTRDGRLRLVHAGDGRSLRSQPDRLKAELESIVLTVLRERLLQPGGESLATITNEVRVAVNDFNLDRPKNAQLRAPCSKTIHRRIGRIPGIELVRIQKSKTKDRLAYQVVGKIKRPNAPLLEAEFDWKLVPVWVYSKTILDEYGNALIYRPWKGTLVDRFNGAVLGHFMTAVDPSRQEFFAFLRDLIKPLPSATRREFGRSLVSVQRGAPRAITLDKASELIGDDSVESLHDLGISIRPTGPYSPWQKPFVESLHSAETKELFSKLPGYAPKLSDEEAPRSIEGLLSDQDLFERIESYFYEVRWLGRAKDNDLSPKHAFEAFVRANPGWAPPMPRSLETLDRCLTIRIEATATTHGIRYQNLHYNSNWVRDIRSDLHAHAEGNPVVKVLIRPHDLGAVYVEHPGSGELKLVPSLMPHYTRGLDLFRHARVEQAKKLVRRLTHEEDEAYRLRILSALIDVAKLPARQRRFSNRSGIAFLNATTASGQECPLDVVDREAANANSPMSRSGVAESMAPEEPDDGAAETMRQLAELQAQAKDAASTLSSAIFANDDAVPKWRTRKGA